MSVAVAMPWHGEERREVRQIWAVAGRSDFSCSWVKSRPENLCSPPPDLWWRSGARLAAR